MTAVALPERLKGQEIQTGWSDLLLVTSTCYLIDDDNRVGRQVRIAGDLTQQQPFGEEEDAGRSTPGRVEPHLLDTRGGKMKQASPTVTVEGVQVHTAVNTWSDLQQR